MRYLALLYGEETDAWEPGSGAFADDLAAYERFDEAAGDAVVAGEALQPTGTAVTVRGAGTRPLVTDGPFAETAAVVGGMYVLEAADLDAALELARRIPAAVEGAVEVRPLVEWFERPDNGADAGGGVRYLALIHEPPSDADLPGTPAWERAAAAHARFGEEAGDALLGGAALHPPDTATTVRVRDGQLHVTDGPFAETAEVIGGLYLLRAAGRDEAVALARRIPVAAGGGVELRPVLDV